MGVLFEVVEPFVPIFGQVTALSAVAVFVVGRLVGGPVGSVCTVVALVIAFPAIVSWGVTSWELLQTVPAQWGRAWPVGSVDDVRVLFTRVVAPVFTVVVTPVGAVVVAMSVVRAQIRVAVVAGLMVVASWFVAHPAIMAI